MLNAVLRLRRDNDYNYAKIANSFVPANGEICLVDTVPLMRKRSVWTRC